jgi:RNA polymerase sigma-70 factor (ECF subfamily)
MSETSPTDVQLLARIAQREPRALEILYERYATQVFSLALAMLRDRDQAADLTQEVFLLVWRHAAIYRPTGSARSWLLRLVRNRAIDEMRRTRRRQHWRTSAPAALATHGTSLTSELLDVIVRQEVREAVAALPELHREALLLAFFHGLSHHEIAIRLQTPLGTIKARIRRALLTLRHQLLDKRPES